MTARSGGALPLDFAALSKLAHEHGDAFYLLDVDRFRANLRGLRDAFRQIYPASSLGYSYKTNYTPLLCQVADEEGCYAEVVSRMEYDLALRLGVPPERVIFNGPLKAPRDIEEALLAGAVVNLDSPLEVEAVEDAARRRPGARLRVGVRCHLALDASHLSRFGVSTEGGELAAVLERLRALPACEVNGLHCHFSSHRGAEGFRLRAERMVRLTKEHFPTTQPPTLDLGGGLLGPMPASLRDQLGDVPDWTEYAQAIAPVLAAAFPGADAPELILEPGAAVVADAFQFVARVAVLKRVGRHQVAVTSGSVQNIKARPSPVKQPMLVVRDGAAGGDPQPGPWDVTGYTCMEIDVLYPGYPGELRVGDFVVFENVGAYTTVFKPPFILPAPAILAVSEADGLRVARRREELDDLLVSYSLQRGPRGRE